MQLNQCKAIAATKQGTCFDIAAPPPDLSNRVGCYLTRTLDKVPFNGVALFFGASFVDLDKFSRHDGLPIRPVRLP